MNISEMRNYISYRFSVLAGIFLLIFAVIAANIHHDTAPVIILFLILPALAATGIFLLIFDLIFKTKFRPLKWNSKLLISFEGAFIGFYAAGTGLLLLNIIIPPSKAQISESLVISGIYLAAGLFLAILIIGIVKGVQKLFKK